MTEKDFSLHADPDAWKSEYICDNCVNKLSGCRTCDLLTESEQLDAMSRNQCDYYYQKQSEN